MADALRDILNAASNGQPYSLQDLQGADFVEAFDAAGRKTSDSEPQPAYAVSVGNPYDGMTLYGPFDSPEEGGEFASTQEECHLVTLNPPDDAK